MDSASSEVRSETFWRKGDSMAPKRKEEGVLQEQVPPKQRGFATLSVTEKDGHRTRTRLEEWCRDNGHVGAKRKPDADSAINALLDAYRAPQAVPAVPPAPSIPWDAIRDALIGEFGFIAHEKVDRAIQAAKEALP